MESIFVDYLYRLRLNRADLQNLQFCDQIRRPHNKLVKLLLWGNKMRFLKKIFQKEQDSVLQALIEKDIPLAKKRLYSGGDLGTTDDLGNVALHYAAAFGDIDLIKGILDTGFPFDPLNKEGQPPLVYAMEYDQPEAASFIWQHYKVAPLVGQAHRANDEFTQLTCYVAELCFIGVDWTLPPGEASSGFFQKNSQLKYKHHPRAREIGRELRNIGGIELMRIAHESVSDFLGRRAASNLSSCWHKIGWDGTEEEYNHASAAMAMEMAGRKKLQKELQEKLNNCWIH